MKRLLPIFTLLLVMLCGCKKYDLTPIWDKLNEHESRISALEELCKRLNTNIESLQSIITALEQNDYVTKVVSIMDEDKEVGYTIHFSKSKAVTIYHGKHGDKGDKGDQGDKGEDGAPGAKGETPDIGVKRDTDGVYYWTLDGEWLLDDSGNKIPASGPKGDSGDKGSDGNNGNDGITPKLKIENNYWYVSYDDGETWTELGKATGEDGEDGKNGQDGKPGADGENGANGENGDSFFQSVDTSNENYIILTLADGTRIKIPTWKAFEELQALVNQINSNLSALQTIVDAIQNNDYVTSVTPVTENGKVIGYSIAFSKSGSIVIYHGQDGKDGDKGDKGDQGDKGEDGAPGANGGTPNIGVKRDTDGVYYWTLDGEWLLDDSGNKIPASGPKGDSGDKGSDGNNGNDGITPKLKIENNYWYVSYDDGETWTELGKATGEDGEDGKNGQDGKPGADGENGANGENGDSFFQSVDTSNENYIILTLADGTMIKIPTWKAFEELQALVNQINSNLSALQTIVDAIQNNDYVTSVTPVTENGKVIGYSIAFSKSGSIVIYHGQDGKDGDKGDKGDQGDKGEDGAPGAKGETPDISVKRDTDGVYYWTLDGEWLLDDSGNKIPASGPKGDSGDKGSDGNNGNDGITPKLKIENNYWYVSYDDGETWTELGKATGEDGEDGKPGKDGQNGQDGSCFFKSIDISHSEFIIFTLTNGEQIIIPTSQGVSKEGLEDIYASTYGVIPGTVDMAKMNILLTEAKGKTVRFNDGVYVFPSHITVPSDISFIGNTKTVFKLAENSGSNVLFFIVQASNVTISRIFIDGGLSSQPDPESKDDILDKNNHIGNRYGIWCEKSRRIKIQDVEIYGWNLCGVYCKNNDSGGGETGRFYHAVEITNSSFYYNYYGFWADQYGEYNKINASNFGDNFIGVRNEGGNNMYVGCFFNGNYCGFALNGENIKNESHGGCYSCTYNHNSVTGLGGGIAIYANHSTVGWNFNGQNIWYGAVTLKDCKGIIFNSNIWGNVQFSSKDSQGRKKMNLVTNTYFYTNPQSIYNGSDGSTYFESCIDGTAAN